MPGGLERRLHGWSGRMTVRAVVGGGRDTVHIREVTGSSPVLPTKNCQSKVEDLTVSE